MGACEKPFHNTIHYGINWQVTVNCSGPFL
jgi:hypothetical protein